VKTQCKSAQGKHPYKVITHTLASWRGLSPDLVCVNILLSKGPLQHERLPVVVIVVILFVCAWSGLSLRGQSGKEFFCSVSPIKLNPSVPNALHIHPALALAHTLNLIRHLLQLPLPFGLVDFNGVAWWAKGASSWKFTVPLVLCCIPQITDTHILYWACIKDQIPFPVPRSRPISISLPHATTIWCTLWRF